MTVFLPFLLYSSIVSLDKDPSQALRVYSVKNQIARYSVSETRNVTDVKANERGARFGSAWRAWEAGSDSAEMIGTLRALIAEDRTEPFRFDLARVLQSEGRNVEAAQEYWLSCHRKRGRGNPYEGNCGYMARIGDALEDVGRHEDAIWAYAQTGFGNRRAAFLDLRFQASPEWRRKWAKKLLADRPDDAEAKEMLYIAEAQLSRPRRESEKTRDVPRT